MAFLLSHLLGLAGLVLVLYAGGFLIESVCGALPLPELGGFVRRTAAGSVAFIYALFALAVCGGYRASIVLPLMAVVVAAAAFRAGPAAFWRRLRAAGAASGRPGATLLALLPVALVMLALVIRAASLGVGWDDDVYHLVLPKLYLKQHGFVRVPFNVYSHWPHNVELLFGAAMMLDDHVLAKLVHTLYLCLLVTAVYRVTRRQCSRAVASLAGLLLLGNDVVLQEGIVANIDIAFALYFLLAVVCADAYLRTRAPQAIVWAGVFCGALAGTKLSGLAGIACVAGLLVCRAPARLREPRFIRELALGLGLPVLLLAAPWYIKSYLYTGNPLYPLFFRQLGGIEWSEQVGQQFFAWQEGMGMGRTWRDYLLLPLRVVTQSEHGYPNFDGILGQTWLVAVPLAIVVSIKRDRGRSELIAAGLYFVFWAVSSQQLRFLIAALPLLAIAAGHALETLIELCARERLRQALRVAALSATFAAAWPMFRLTLVPAWAEARQLVQHGPGQLRDVIGEGYTFLNERTPREARVLFINENRGFFLERSYVADSFPEASQLSWYLGQASSQAEVRARLDALGISHIYFRRAKRRPIALSQPVLALLDNPEQVKRVYRCKRARCSIYALR